MNLALSLFRAQKKSEEDEESEEFVNFERYQDMIKHRCRACRYIFFLCFVAILIGFADLPFDE